MGSILRGIYDDTSISSLLGFKGGTCAYFFYDLPRFSVDLDFDLLSHDEDLRQRVCNNLEVMIKGLGVIKDRYIKYNTIFHLLSYGDTDHNIKVEVNTRMLIPNMKEGYEIRGNLGISMLVAKKDYMFASKLAALTTRKQTAMRDIYDVWFFAKNGWDINCEVVKARTGKTIKVHLADCIEIVKKVKDNEILRGLGELLSESQKDWVRTILRNEAILMLENYRSAFER